MKLAPNAVVVLSHLCYASGNSEPGLAEGSQSIAIQRVDNYAAGFIRAGAQAVVAEAHLGPAYYVRSLLRGQHSIEQIWRASPNNNGNTMTLASKRSNGFAERLDPDRASGGYNRSLVSHGVNSDPAPVGRDRHHRRAPTSSILQPPVTPSLMSLGLTFGQVSIRSLPIVAARTQLVVPVAARGAKKMPDGTQVGIRWDPILLDAPPGAAGGDHPGAVALLRGRLPRPSAHPTSTSSSPSSWVPWSTLAPAQRTGKGLSVGVTYPSAPGLYRLVVTLHDSTGVAYDAPTQSKLTSAIVRVGGLYSAAFGAPTLAGPHDRLDGDGRRPGRQRRLAGLGRRVDQPAGRAGLAADLAAHVADRGAGRRDVGLGPGHAGSRSGLGGARSQRPPRRVGPRRSASSSWRRSRRATTCCCSMSSPRRTAPSRRSAARRRSSASR